MSFLDLFSHTRKDAGSVVLIDIGTNTVTGTYAQYREGELPAVLYTKSQAIEAHENELKENAMLRALTTLGDALIREGAPVLARVTGSGSARLILVSIDAPWQMAIVHTEEFEEQEPFVFTENLVNRRLEETHTVPADKLLADQSVVGTILNGYETRNPYGKKVYRASVIVLTSLIEQRVANSIIQVLERLYHTKNILPISGSSLRYQAVRDLFPHERDAIILDATNKELPSISLVRKGLFVSLIQAEAPTENEWVTSITGELTEIAKQYPLPRTIFLLTQESETDSLKEKLDGMNFSSLWLSDNPPKIVPISQNNLSGIIRQSTENVPDIVTLLMALYFKNRRRALAEGV